MKCLKSTPLYVNCVMNAGLQHYLFRFCGFSCYLGVAKGFGSSRFPWNDWVDENVEFPMRLTFFGHNEDVHEIMVFSHDSPMNNEDQVNDRWPNYATDFSVGKSNFNHLRMFFNPVCVVLLRN